MKEKYANWKAATLKKKKENRPHTINFRWGRGRVMVRVTSFPELLRKVATQWNDGKSDTAERTRDENE